MNLQIKNIISEIQQLPLSKRFEVLEHTLKSIKKEELSSIQKSKHTDDDIWLQKVNEPSLAKDWLSEEDNRWDNLL